MYKQKVQTLPCTLYCDEAGNTGSNYLDAAQPIHVLAGWLVPPEAHKAWADTLFRLGAHWQGSELHAHKLWKRERGKRLLLGVLEAGARHMCVPLLSVSYKRACLAFRLIDAFMDPVTNPIAAWLPFEFNDKRKFVAKLIDQYAREQVYTFGEKYKDATVLAWRDVAENLATALEASKAVADPTETETLSRIVITLRGASGAMEEIVAEELRSDPGDTFTRRDIAISLNLPVFVQFTRLADDTLAKLGRKAEVLHDETRQFRTAFDQAFSLSKAVGRLRHVTPLQDGRRILLGTGHLTSFNTADSKSVIGLQAADALATCAFRIATMVHTGEPFDAITEAICAAVYSLNWASRFTGEPTGWDDYVGFSDDWEALGRAALAAATASGWPQNSPAILP